MRRNVKKVMFMIFLTGFFVFVLCGLTFAQDKSKIKFYNFDDLLIDGKVTKPKMLFIDARQRVKFEKLLKLKKDFIPKLKGTERDPALR